MKMMSRCFFLARQFLIRRVDKWYRIISGDGVRHHSLFRGDDQFLIMMTADYSGL